MRTGGLTVAGLFNCFIFSNELDTLEFTDAGACALVNRFVIVEADQTFQGQVKPLHFADHRARYAPFNDKIEHVVVHDRHRSIEDAGLAHGPDFIFGTEKGRRQDAAAVAMDAATPLSR